MSSASTEVAFVLHGGIVDSKNSTELNLLEDGLIGVDGTGKIIFCEPFSSLYYLQDQYSFDKSIIVHLKPNEMILPGFIDTHIHASQYPNAGNGLDLPLLQWLEKYTFPIESKFSDLTFAKAAYEKVVKRTLFSGTTTASYFATIHKDATTELAKICNSMGQRAYVGKVNMDRNSPDFYIETTQQSVRDTEEFITSVQGLYSNLVTPIVTPRFVPTCSGQLMKSLADVARSHNLPIQSHVSENKGEVEWVASLHPNCKSYAEVYDSCGLLTEKTIMAHGVFLTDDEMQLFSARKVGVSHCPCSNFGICSGICNVRKLQSYNVDVGLGTDVSGGYSPTLLHGLRLAIIASQSLHFSDKTIKPLSTAESFYLATLGSAKVMKLDHEIGNFIPGKKFDAFIVNPHVQNSPIDIFEKDSFVDRLDKYLYNGDDRNVTTVFVNGRVVKMTSDSPSF